MQAHNITQTQKKEVLSFAGTQMDPVVTMVTEISCTEKGKYHTVVFTCGNQKKNWAPRCREQIGGYQSQGFGAGAMGEGGQKDTNFQL